MDTPKDNRSSTPRRSRAAGFTLIELVTSMAIISIAVTVFAQRLKISDEREVEIAASAMVRNLDMARAQAISQRQAVLVQFDAGEDKYRAFVDHDRNGVIDKNATEINAFPEFRSVALGTVVEYGIGGADRLPVDSLGTGEITFSSNEVRFDSRGIPTPFGTRGTIYLKHRDDPKVVAAVYVSGSASVRMYRFVDGVWK